jgi:hypothetical protein
MKKGESTAVKAVVSAAYSVATDAALDELQDPCRTNAPKGFTLIADSCLAKLAAVTQQLREVRKRKR